MRHVILTVLIALISIGNIVSAQESGVMALSLAQAQEYALKNAVSVKTPCSMWPAQKENLGNNGHWLAQVNGILVTRMFLRCLNFLYQLSSLQELQIKTLLLKMLSWKRWLLLIRKI